MPSIPNAERRKMRRFQQLGSDHPICGTCGEADWRCMEAHHVADFDRDDATVCICFNCHRKVSDDQRDHPAFDRAADPMLDRIGHFLLGLADLLRIVIKKLAEFGHALIGRSLSAPNGEAMR